MNVQSASVLSDPVLAAAIGVLVFFAGSAWTLMAVIVHEKFVGGKK
jgi:hypothetical protein